jgi:hypothetical protein
MRGFAAIRTSRVTRGIPELLGQGDVKAVGESHVVVQLPGSRE